MHWKSGSVNPLTTGNHRARDPSDSATTFDSRATSLAQDIVDATITAGTALSTGTTIDAKIKFDEEKNDLDALITCLHWKQL